MYRDSILVAFHDAGRVLKPSNLCFPEPKLGSVVASDKNSDRSFSLVLAKYESDFFESA